MNRRDYFLGSFLSDFNSLFYQEFFICASWSCFDDVEMFCKSFSFNVNFSEEIVGYKTVEGWVL